MQGKTLSPFAAVNGELATEVRKLDFVPDAELELQGAAQRYEQARPGLGTEFLQEISTLVETRRPAAATKKSLVQDKALTPVGCNAWLARSA
jgi:hypothetical protein